MASDDLAVILEGRLIGRITRASSGTLRLTFDDEYLDDPAATLLSVSMPSPVREHADTAIRPWLWGLLPDDADVLARWGAQFEVSASSPFSLLGTQIGHDCAGAVQLCPPDEVDDLLGRPGHVEPLTDAQVAQRLRELRADSTAWLGRAFTGQFSLGGAQAKTALHHDASGWGLPAGSVPTTHILKPAIGGLDGHDLNEHLCLTAARDLGLTAVRTRVASFDDQTAIVVERYDRRLVDGALRRVHQEDLCQALRVSPTMKYQSEGGPSPARIVDLFRRALPHPAADEATWRFVDALAFNWVIAGTDAHAKNYSLLLAGNQVRLAPLYDIASALPYDDSKGHDLRLAMKLGGDYRLRATDRPGTWAKVARELNLDVALVTSRVADLVRRIPGAVTRAAADPAVAGIGSDLPDRLCESVTTRAGTCLGLVGG